MDEKTYQALLNGEINELDISGLSEECQKLVREFYEFLLQKQQEK